MTERLPLIQVASVREKSIPLQPSKPSKAPFEGFEGDLGRPFQKFVVLLLAVRQVYTTMAGATL
jgi:hypothetical protein